MAHYVKRLHQGGRGLEEVSLVKEGGGGNLATKRGEALWNS